MDEKDTAEKSQDSKFVETSKWAERAMWCVRFGYIAPVIWVVAKILLALLPFSISFKLVVRFILNTVLIGGSIIFIISGLVIGIVVLARSFLSKRRTKGKGKAATAIIISVVYIFLAVVFVIPLTRVIDKFANHGVCPEHLAGLGRAIGVYAEKHNAYPPADKWCDILLKTGDVNEWQFKCPFSKKTRCSYSINPNCEPNSPPDMVLLFESKGGWNSFSGPELVNVDNHDGVGFHILYNDGHIVFEVVDFNDQFLNDKFIKELNWGDKK